MIRHLGSGNLFDLGAQDLTALLLLIYFKKDLTLDDVVEWMDPELLLHSLASKMAAGALNRSQIVFVISIQGSAKYSWHSNSLLVIMSVSDMAKESVSQKQGLEDEQMKG